MPCKHCGQTKSYHQNMIEEMRPRRLYRSGSEEATEQIDMLRREMNELRRDNNKAVLEAAYLKKENNLYLKRLKEEHIVRER